MNTVGVNLAGIMLFIAGLVGTGSVILIGESLNRKRKGHHIDRAGLATGLAFLVGAATVIWFITRGGLS